MSSTIKTKNHLWDVESWRFLIILEKQWGRSLPGGKGYWRQKTYYCCSLTKLCQTLCNSTDCSMPDSFALHYTPCLLKFMSTESVILSNHLILFVLFSCLQSFPASESFPKGQFFASGGQGIGASATVLPMNIQGWFPLGLTDLISLLSRGLLRVFCTTIRKHQFFSTLSMESQKKT